MQLAAVESQEGSVCRLGWDHVHDSRRCGNLLRWRRSAFVYGRPPRQSFVQSLCHCYFLTNKQRWTYLVCVYMCFLGRKFVSILMRFWYLTSARLPEDNLEGTRVFQVAIGGETETETKRLLSANYESVTDPLTVLVHHTIPQPEPLLDLKNFCLARFQREFTQGVAPDWTITRIEHSKLLDWAAPSYDTVDCSLTTATKSFHFSFAAAEEESVKRFQKDGLRRWWKHVDAQYVCFCRFIPRVRCVSGFFWMILLTNCKSFAERMLFRRRGEHNQDYV